MSLLKALKVVDDNEEVEVQKQKTLSLAGKCKSAVHHTVRLLQLGIMTQSMQFGMHKNFTAVIRISSNEEKQNINNNELSLSPIRLHRQHEDWHISFPPSNPSYNV